jgi:hypothetical protein
MANAVTEPATASAPRKPVKSYRLRGISVSVFENSAAVDGRRRTFHKVSFEKSYRDGDEWKTTQSLGRDDLPIAGLLLKQAWQFILEAEAARGKDEADKE